MKKRWGPRAKKSDVILLSLLFSVLIRFDLERIDGEDGSIETVRACCGCSLNSSRLPVVLSVTRLALFQLLS